MSRVLSEASHVKWLKACILKLVILFRGQNLENLRGVARSLRPVPSEKCSGFHKAQCMVKPVVIVLHVLSFHKPLCCTCRFPLPFRRLCRQWIFFPKDDSPLNQLHNKSIQKFNFFRRIFFVEKLGESVKRERI